MSRSQRLTLGRYDYAACAGFVLYASGSAALPVGLVALAEELGFSLEAGGTAAGGALPLGRTAAIVLSMLLCGFLAGRWGKRRTLGISFVLVGAGLALCAAAPGYGVLFLALTAVGLGEGVVEGLSTPFVQTLHPRESGRYLNFTHAFWSVGIFSTVLIAGALLTLGVSWRLVLGGVAALAAVPAALLLLPEGRGQKYPEHPEPLHWKTVRGQTWQILKIPRFWLFFVAMFAAGGGEACLTYWSASYIQLHFSAAAWAGGAGLACFAAGMIIGRIGWSYVIEQHHLRRLIAGSALAGTLLTLPIPSLEGLYLFFAMLLLAGLATAPFWPSLQSLCADCLPDTDATMLMILLSCAGIPGSGLFIWLMGWLAGRHAGLGGAFYLVPASFLIVAVIVGLDQLFYTARRRIIPQPRQTLAKSSADI